MKQQYVFHNLDGHTRLAAEPGMEVGASPAVPYSVPLEPEFTPETKPR